MVYPLVSGAGVPGQNLTPLMRGKEQAARAGSVHNACPFGCDVGDLSEHGYCKHLVGFTADGKTYQPRKLNARQYEFVDGSDPQPVQPGDKLVQITTSSRVYRQDGNVPMGKVRRE